MTGVEFLEQAQAHAPDAKLVLLTAYADTDVAIKAINDIGLDYYLLKPWDPPEERLYPVLDDLLERLARRRIRRRSDGIRVVGHRWSERSHEIKTFLARNHVPYRWLDLERDDEARPAARLGAGGTGDLPLVLVPDGEPLRAPSTLDLAGALGLRTSAEQPLYDLCIVGGGPAGLGGRRLRRLRGAADGRRRARGARRAGRPERGDRELPRLPEGPVRRRPHAPRRRPGPRASAPRWCSLATSSGFEARGPVRAVRFDDGAEIEARAVLVATGVSYRLLDAPGLAELTGRGVYYGATAERGRAVRGRRRLRRRRGELGRPGGAQPRPLRPSGSCCSCGPTRSRRPCRSTSSSASGPPTTSRCGSRPRWWRAAATATSRRSRSPTARSGAEEEVATNWLFVFIGASPRTDWLGDEVARDEQGFVITGHDLLRARSRPALAARPAPVRARDERARRVRGRRRAARLDEARRVGRRRGRDVGLPRAPLPGDDLMERRRAPRTRSCSTGSPTSSCGELVAAGEEVPFAAGDELFREGEPADYWWVLLEGGVELVRRAGREETVVADDGPPGRLGRRLPGLERRGGYLATGRGASAGRMFRVPAAALGELARTWFPFGVHLIDGFFQTVRDMEAHVAPARGAGRARHARRRARARAQQPGVGGGPGGRRARARPATTLLSSLGAAGRAVALAPSSSSRSTRCAASSTPPPRGADPVALADREDALSTGSTRTASTTAGASRRARGGGRRRRRGASGSAERARRRHARGPALEWVASTLSTRALLAEVKESTRRISDARRRGQVVLAARPGVAAARSTSPRASRARS